MSDRQHWTPARIVEAEVEFWRRFDALDVPDEPRAPTVWVAGGALAAGPSPREALRWAVAVCVQSWRDDAAAGLLAPDDLPWEWAAPLLDGAPVTLHGPAPHVAALLAVAGLPSGDVAG